MDRTRSDWRWWALALCCIGCQAAAGGVVPAPPQFEPVRRYVQKAIAEGLAPSAAVAVVRDGKLVWSEAIGYADLERRIKAAPDSIYRLASVSKPITATGLMILVERGQIDLDAPANRYLPGTKLRAYIGSADGMTVRRLANHSSGLPLHYTFYYDGVQPPSVDEAIRRYGFAATEPGSKRQYSNLAFGILGYITEVVSGKSWRQFMTDEVYGPLKMDRTWDGVRPGREADATAQYARDAAGRFVPVADFGFDHPGASAIWSSAKDLARFALMHLNGGVLDGVRILSERSVRQMQEITSRRPDGGGNGVAWAVNTFRGHRCIWHSGGMPGVATLLRLYPDDRAATIVLTNTDLRTVANEVTDRLAAALFPKQPGPEPQPAAKKPSPKPNKHGLDLACWVGRWHGKLVHFDGDIELALAVKDRDHVQVRFGDRAPLPLSDLKWDGDGLRGQVTARLRTIDCFHGVPTIQFRLRQHEDRIVGVAVARATGYFALSHWVQLRRQPPEGP